MRALGAKLASSVAETESPNGPLTGGLQKQVSHVMQQLKSNKSVDPASVAPAEAHSTHPLDSFKQTLEQHTSRPSVTCTDENECKAEGV